MCEVSRSNISAVAIEASSKAVSHFEVLFFGLLVGPLRMSEIKLSLLYIIKIILHMLIHLKF